MTNPQNNGERSKIVPGFFLPADAAEVIRGMAYAVLSAGPSAKTVLKLLDQLLTINLDTAPPSLQAQPPDLTRREPGHPRQPVGPQVESAEPVGNAVDQANDGHPMAVRGPALPAEA